MIHYKSTIDHNTIAIVSETGHNGFISRRMTNRGRTYFEQSTAAGYPVASGPSVERKWNDAIAQRDAQAVAVVERKLFGAR